MMRVALVGTAKTELIIKRYRNRRLYNVGSGEYTTLKELTSLAKSGRDFVVYDAVTGADLTRSVLGQVLMKEEKKDERLLPTRLLRQLIRFQGENTQALVSTYLDLFLYLLARQQQQLQKQITETTNRMEIIDAQVRQNFKIFEQLFSTARNRS